MNRDLPRTFPGLPAELTPRPAAPSLRARYDAASTSSEDAAHWANVDYFSATGALTATVRATVRAKSRYETANNPYVRGMVETVTNSTIGVGPRLQMLTGDKAADKVVEEQFAIWSRAVNLPSKLRLLCRSGYVVDGEALALAINNPRLPCDVKLDLRPVEAEQLSTPAAASFDPNVVDGIRFDAAGNPVQYYFYPRHPGDIFNPGQFEPKPVEAEFVFHWFRQERPGQVRGISQLAASLKSFADLRRYRQAVIGAAETAASISAGIESTAPADDSDSTGDEAFDEIELPRRGGVVIPAGWKLNQLKAEQPTQSYEGFCNANLNEAGRSLFLPDNLARGNSSNYNFASGRLDHLDFYRLVRVMQQDAELSILDRLLALWLDEAVLSLGVNIAPAAQYPHRWLWGGYESVNPVDDANAFDTLFKIGAATLEDYWGQRGHDPEEKIAAWKKERAAVSASIAAAVPQGSATGSPTAGGAPAAAPSIPAGGDPQQPEGAAA